MNISMIRRDLDDTLVGPSGSPPAFGGPPPDIGDCPSSSAVADRLTGSLPAGDPGGVAVHVDNCPECRLKVMAFRTALLAFAGGAAGRVPLSSARASMGKPAGRRKKGQR